MNKADLLSDYQDFREVSSEDIESIKKEATKVNIPLEDVLVWIGNSGFYQKILVTLFCF